MLNVPNVDDLVFESGHLVPGEATLWGRQVKRINTCVDHLIALVAVFEKFVAGKRFTRLGRTVPLPGNTANEVRFLAMSRPRSKIFLALM
jgi:hypothetical protein